MNTTLEAEFTGVTNINHYEILMELYMRRGNKVYFRTQYEPIRKLVIELGFMPQDVKDINYGTVINCSFDVN